MGRLTLNVLLSFAQFEREVTGERIRDKIAASKRKGMWMGGFVPLGYSVQDRQLVIEPDEAEKVRKIYRLYLEVACVSRLQRHLEAEKIYSKARVSRSGRHSGGVAFSRGALYELLQSRLYLGEIAHKDAVYAGQHAAILDRATWDRVQSKLQGNIVAPRRRPRVSKQGLLTGLIFDDHGNRFVPTHTVKGEKRYRYYTSQAVIDRRRTAPNGPTRVPAEEVEELVVTQVRCFLQSRERIQEILDPTGSDVHAIGRAVEFAAKWKSASSNQVRALVLRSVCRVVVRDRSIELQLNGQTIWEAAAKRMPASPGESLPLAEDITIDVPAAFKRCGGEVRLLLPPEIAQDKNAVPSLVRAVARAHDWVDRILKGEISNQRAIAVETGLDERYIGQIIPLAFMAPDFLETIIDGRQSPTMTLNALSDCMVHDWETQRERVAAMQENPRCL